MRKWILISVCDREIFCAVHDTHKKAKEQRDIEMANAGVDEEYFKKYDEYENLADEAEDRFGFDVHNGYSNLLGHERSWKIVPIVFEEDGEQGTAFKKENGKSEEKCEMSMGTCPIEGCGAWFALAYMTAYSSLKDSFAEDLKKLKEQCFAKRETGPSPFKDFNIARKDVDDGK